MNFKSPVFLVTFSEKVKTNSFLVLSTYFTSCLVIVGAVLSSANDTNLVVSLSVELPAKSVNNVAFKVNVPNVVVFGTVTTYLVPVVSPGSFTIAAAAPLNSTKFVAGSFKVAASSSVTKIVVGEVATADVTVGAALSVSDTRTVLVIGDALFPAKSVIVGKTKVISLLAVALELSKVMRITLLFEPSTNAGLVAERTETPSSVAAIFVSDEDFTDSDKVTSKTYLLTASTFSTVGFTLSDTSNLPTDAANFSELSFVKTTSLTRL